MYQTKKDREMIKLLDRAVSWFGVEKTIEMLEEYNQDFEGMREECLASGKDGI